MSLSVSNVSFEHLGNRLVSDISFHVSSGEIVGLLGPNGAGKSTLLKLISGSIPPTIGDVMIDGFNVKDASSVELSLQRSVMSQSSSVVFDFSVEEVLTMGWVQSRILPRKYFSQAIASVLEACDLTPLLQRTFNTLSGGEQQRVQFARSLLQLWRPPDEDEQPRYLLLDEPTASLDIAHELQLLNLLVDAKQRNIGILIVLHDLNLAARYLDKVVLLNGSKLVDVGVPEKVLSAEQLTRVYDTQIFVERNAQLNRLIIHT